jgi:FMN-dependent NADH-azoreductase
MNGFKNILALQSSARDDGSHSRELTRRLLARLQSQNPTATVRVRDLAANALPHASAEFTRAIFVPPPALTESDKATLALSDSLIAELVSADVLVIAAPMYNLTIPSTLKAWIDHIVRPGLTFGFTDNPEQPFEGLLKNKQAIIVTTSGGVFRQGPRQAEDFVVPYLKHILGFVGITDLTVVSGEGLAFDPVGGLSAAEHTIDSLSLNAQK